jgi:hypothetical protein
MTSMQAEFVKQWLSKEYVSAASYKGWRLDSCKLLSMHARAQVPTAVYLLTIRKAQKDEGGQIGKPKQLRFVVKLRLLTANTGDYEFEFHRWLWRPNALPRANSIARVFTIFTTKYAAVGHLIKRSFHQQTHCAVMVAEYG